MLSLLYILLAAGAVCPQVSAAPHDNNGHHHYHNHKPSSSRVPSNAAVPATTLISLPTLVIETATITIDENSSTSLPPSPTFVTKVVTFSSVDNAEPTSTDSSIHTASPSTAPNAPAPAPAPVPGTLWKPQAGATWQIELQGTITDTSVDADIFDMDLFDNSADTVATLHGLNRKVICYFSAGTFEDWRPDVSSFQAADKGSAMEDWPGEFWLNTKSDNVRAIMTSRIELAVSKGCDGIDPDNVDGYNNANGLGLTSADAIDYLTFLSNTAHSHGLSIGLKNAGEIVKDVLPIMEWEVNEQCAEMGECATFAPFTDVGKPVFHIEYVSGTSSLTTQSTQACGGAPSGFSSVLKKLNLDAWLQPC